MEHVLDVLTFPFAWTFNFCLALYLGLYKATISIESAVVNNVMLSIFYLCICICGLFRWVILKGLLPHSEAVQKTLLYSEDFRRWLGYKKKEMLELLLSSPSMPTKASAKSQKVMFFGSSPSFGGGSKRCMPSKFSRFAKGFVDLPTSPRAARSPRLSRTARSPRTPPSTPTLMHALSEPSLHRGMMPLARTESALRPVHSSLNIESLASSWINTEPYLIPSRSAKPKTKSPPSSSQAQSPPEQPPPLLQSELQQLNDELQLKGQTIQTLEHEVSLLTTQVRDLEQQHSANLQQLYSTLSEKEKYIQLLEQQRQSSHTRSMRPLPSSKPPSLNIHRPLKRRANDMEFETLQTRLDTAKSVNSWLSSEFKRLEKENALKLASRENEIQDLQAQLEYLRKFQQNLPLDKQCIIQEHNLEQLKAENEILRNKYFNALAVNTKLQQTREGQVCNLDVSELYERTKRDKIDIQQWPKWIAAEVLSGTLSY